MGKNNSNGYVLGMIVLCVMLMLVKKNEGFEFIVGGQKGWSVPADPNFNPYNTWAEKSRFQIGDSLGQFLITSISCPFSFYTHVYCIGMVNTINSSKLLRNNKMEQVKREKVYRGS